MRCLSVRTSPEGEVEVTDFDAELVEFGLNVMGNLFFELLTTLEEFFHGHLGDEDTSVRFLGFGEEIPNFTLDDASDDVLDVLRVGTVVSS